VLAAVAVEGLVLPLDVAVMEAEQELPQEELLMLSLDK
jgi:hypothetical protein